MIRARIGIVSWNTAQLLDRCLASLPTATQDMDAEVVVVDNASLDSSVEICDAHGVRVVRNTSNKGYAAGINEALTDGLRPGGTDVLIALNPDTECPPRSLTALAETLLAEPDVGLVVPRLRNLDGTLQHSVYRFPSTAVTFASSFLPARMHHGRIARRMWLEGSPSPEFPCAVDWAIGAVHVIRASAVEGRAPYCDRWFMYAEDLDLCWNLHQRGWRCVFHPEIEITHVGNAAGAQAWGGDRTRRWLDCTYDWYRVRRGARAARRWAVANTIGTLARLPVVALHRVSGRPPATWERELRLALPVHLRAVWWRAGAGTERHGDLEGGAELTELRGP